VSSWAARWTLGLVELDHLTQIGLCNHHSTLHVSPVPYPEDLWSGPNPHQNNQERGAVAIKPQEGFWTPQYVALLVLGGDVDHAYLNLQAAQHLEHLLVSLLQLAGILRACTHGLVAEVLAVSTVHQESALAAHMEQNR